MPWARRRPRGRGARAVEVEPARLRLGGELARQAVQRRLVGRLRCGLGRGHVATGCRDQGRAVESLDGPVGLQVSLVDVHELGLAQRDGAG